MQIVDRRAQWQHSARAIDDQIAPDYQRNWIDKNCSAFRFTQTRHAEHNACVPAWACRWADSKQPRIVTDKIAGGLNLIGQRLHRAQGCCTQLITIDHIFDLRRQHIKRARDRGDQDEWANK
ncbi:hypothetical protein D3C80_939930 [compost metagenome]